MVSRKLGRVACIATCQSRILPERARAFMVLFGQTERIVGIRDTFADISVASRRCTTAVTPITVTSLLLLAAGIVLILGVPAGLYVLVGPVFVVLLAASRAPGCF